MTLSLLMRWLAGISLDMFALTRMDNRSQPDPKSLDPSATHSAFDLSRSSFPIALE
ncbi:unnamed protein product [Mycena citricolor]|uniref:Uncharacterized protein n=1 Tax=Mycena citricolor TaxID=2018698 RepID=A0AAD2HV14_9AGAR|nr:unnamed protein product [Mycena citricolor]